MDNWVLTSSKSSAKGGNKDNTAKGAKSKTPSKKTTYQSPKEDRKALIWYAVILLVFVLFLL